MCSFLNAEEVAVKDAPGVVGCEFRGSFGCFHHYGGTDAAVESAEAFVANDLLEAVNHRGVVVLTWDGRFALQLDTSFDDIEGIPEHRTLVVPRRVSDCSMEEDGHEQDL